MSVQPEVTSASHKRNIRNYILDARFQLKFTSYMVALTMVVAALIGLFLWQTTTRLFSEAEVAVNARSLAAEKSKELGNAVLSNELVQKMDDPAFESQLKERSAAIDREYEREREAIIASRAALLLQQKQALQGLIGALVALIVFVGAAGIVATHRIVGPLFRIRRLSEELSSGKFPLPPHGLRPHDEMKDTFEAFIQMVQTLRGNQGTLLVLATQALETAERSRADAEVVRSLSALQKRLKNSLE